MISYLVLKLTCTQRLIPCLTFMFCNNFSVFFLSLNLFCWFNGEMKHMLLDKIYHSALITSSAICPNHNGRTQISLHFLFWCCSVILLNINARLVLFWSSLIKFSSEMVTGSECSKTILRLKWLKLCFFIFLFFLTLICHIFTKMYWI